MNSITARFIYLDGAGFTYTRGREGFLNPSDYWEYLDRHADRILAMDGATYDSTGEPVTSREVTKS